MSSSVLACHIDLKRAMWKPDYLRYVLRTMAGWGYRHILFEIEDKFRFERHPDIAHPDAWSPAEWRAVTAECRALGLEPVPLVQTIAHAEYVVGLPAYAHLRESPEHTEQYDPGSPEVYRLLADLLDEVIAVFKPREFFHLGADESRSLGTSPKHRTTVQEVGVGGLYLRHMTPLFEYLHRRGLRPIIWADIVLGHPSVIGRLPRDVVLMDWEYYVGGERWPKMRLWGSLREVTWAEYQTIEDAEFRRYLEPHYVDEQTRRDGSLRAFGSVDALRAMGFDVITASAARCYGASMGAPANHIHLPNVFYSARKGFERGLGHCVTSWAVRHAHPETALPAFFAAPWAKKVSGAFDLDALACAFTRDHFGVEIPEMAEAIRLTSAWLPLAESAWLTQCVERAQAGRDPLVEWVASLDKEEGGPPAIAALVEKAAAGFTEARRLFAGMRSKAGRNSASLEFWIEGAELLAFYADFDRALIRGALRTCEKIGGRGDRVPPSDENMRFVEQPIFSHALRREADRLLADLAARRNATRRLFADTYTDRGVEQELSARYGFHEARLRAATEATP